MTKEELLFTRIKSFVTGALCYGAVKGKFNEQELNIEANKITDGIIKEIKKTEKE